MTSDDTYETPFQTDEETQDAAGSSIEETELAHPDDAAEANAAQQAWEAGESTEENDPQQEGELAELAQPFVGRWNTLVSKTNWEKGRIISQWREALIESGVDSHQYSDEAWSRRVGGVTAPHVGRLRRVHDRFATTYETYETLYWSHFLAALDWEDAPMWLEGASREGWSVSGMREQRWQAEGAVDSKRPTASEIVEVDTDEDVVLPAQGGGRTKEYGDESGVASGPLHEEPDFGDGEELMSLAGSENGGTSIVAGAESDPEVIVQPFAGLPELPDDLADAFESLKLAVLRHKTSGWKDADSESIQKYLDAFTVLMQS